MHQLTLLLCYTTQITKLYNIYILLTFVLGAHFVSIEYNGLYLSSTVYRVLNVVELDDTIFN